MKKPPHAVCIALQGKLTLDPITAGGEKGTYIYQRSGQRRKKDGTLTQPCQVIRRVGVRKDNPSAIQLKNRARMAAATAAWKALEPAARQELNWRANAEAISGFNLFVREFTGTHPLSEF